MTSKRFDWPTLCREIRDAVNAADFEVDGDKPIHMDAMLLASPPKAVRDAVARHRAGLNKDPAGYVMKRRGSGPVRAAAEYMKVADAAARYLGLGAEIDKGMKGIDFVAQTTSTTMGLSLLANGILAKPGQEVLISKHDFFTWQYAWKLRCERSDLVYREIALYDDIAAADLETQIVENVLRNIHSKTRIVALTWVHSSTGLKMPIAKIGAEIARLNEGRIADERILFCVDGVHGFGVENTSFRELNCDFLIAGCHKWLFGPRGTGITCATPDAWTQVKPTVPTFLGDSHPGVLHTPGGVACYEHAWAVSEAFEFHLGVGKDRIAAYTSGLAAILKDGFARLANVRVITPMDGCLSSGVVCCDVRGRDANDVVDALRGAGILAMISSPDAAGMTHVRFSPSILNTVAQIEDVVRAVAEIAGQH